MLTPFRFKIGDIVRLTVPVTEPSHPIQVNDTGVIMVLTLDRRGTFASVNFRKEIRLLVAEGNLVLA